MPINRKSIGYIFNKIFYYAVFPLFLFSLFLTLGFFVLGDATKYTFSVIGNYFSKFYRDYYLFWASVTALTLFISFVYINNKISAIKVKTLLLPFISTILLPVVALIPAKSAFQPTAHAIHFILSIVHAILILMVMINFIKKIQFFYLVQKISYFLVFNSFFGSLIILAVVGRNGFFQLYYYVSIFILIIFLLIFFRNKNQV